MDIGSADALVVWVREVQQHAAVALFDALTTEGEHHAVAGKGQGVVETGDDVDHGRAATEAGQG
jgi:hypothetical protein